jgi:hypothetical protein
MNHTTPPLAGNITGAPFITLVDAEGFAVSPGEKNIPEPFPPDPADPADWPAWTDNWHYEPTDRDLADMAAAALEDLEIPAIAGGSPDAYVPTDEDWADFHAWCAEVEARDARNPIYGYE